jgi:hypothetical protein
MELLKLGGRRETLALSSQGSSFSMPRELQHAIAAVSSDLDARAAVDEALNRQAGAHERATQESQEADDELANLEVDLALKGGERNSPRLEATRKKQREALDTLRRVTRVTAALQVKAAEVDENLRRHRMLLQTEVGAQAAEVFAQLSNELRAAAEPLISVLKKAYGVGAAFGLSGALIRQLDAINLPSLVANEPPIISGYRAHSETGTQIDLTSAWRADPAAASMHEALRPLAEVHRRAAAHVDFKIKPVQADRYAHQHATPARIEREREIENENARRRAAAEAARPRVGPQPSQALAVGARS